MANSQEAIDKEYASMRESVQKLGSMVDEHYKLLKQSTGTSPGVIQGSRFALTMQAFKFHQLAAGPVETLIQHYYSTVVVAAIRALLEAGVFEKVPTDGSSITAENLCKSLKIEKDLLVRLMRCATIFGPFAEVGPEEYAHTAFSEAYLNPALRAVFCMMFDEHLPVQTTLVDYFNHNGWKNPQDLSDTPYAFAHRTGGKNLFQHLSSGPQYADRLNKFNNAMAVGLMWHIDIFPWAEELSKCNPDDDTILVVDVGGGHGNATRHLRSVCNGVKGKMILQDRPEAVDSIVEPLPSGVESMRHNFFDPNPVKGALVYFIRRVLHNWPDKEASQILAQLASAMTPGKSRLLINDCVVPVLGTEPEVPWKDISMMSLSSSQRTEKEWIKVLDNAGLKLHRTWTSPGTAVGIIEAHLK